jgi:hypothetical protein
MENDRDEEDDKGLAVGDAESHSCATQFVVRGLVRERRQGGTPTDEDTMEQNAHFEEQALHESLRFDLFALVVFVR